RRSAWAATTPSWWWTSPVPDRSAPGGPVGGPGAPGRITWAGAGAAFGEGQEAAFRGELTGPSIRPSGRPTRRECRGRGGRSHRLKGLPPPADTRAHGERQANRFGPVPGHRRRQPPSGRY